MNDARAERESPSPKEVRSGDREFLMQVAAYLLAQRPALTQQQLVDLLNVSNQSYVSRLIKDAVAEGYLQIVHCFQPQKISAERLREIEQFCEGLQERPHDLKLRLRHYAARFPAAHFHDLVIVSTQALGGKRSRAQKPVQVFAREVAPILLRLLQHCQALGITWGHTLACCVEALREFRQHGLWPSMQLEQVFPLRGEPIWLSRQQGDSPSFLATELQKLFAPDQPPLSLSMVPAFTPLDLSRTTIEKLLPHVPSYARIFGAKGRRGARPLIQSAAILTGIGAVQEGLGDWTAEALKAARVSPDRLRRIAIGDIAGVFLPREGLKAEQRRELEAINANWWGLTREHLAAAAKRAGRNQHPGTIVLALGGDAKARVLLAALQEGLCSTLVISDQIAEALDKLLPPEDKPAK